MRVKVRMKYKSLLGELQAKEPDGEGYITFMAEPLEATPVEESRPWILYSSAANHDKAQKMGIECDCFKPKELKRLYLKLLFKAWKNKIRIKRNGLGRRF